MDQNHLVISWFSAGEQLEYDDDSHHTILLLLEFWLLLFVHSLISSSHHLFAPFSSCLILSHSRVELPIELPAFFSFSSSPHLSELCFISRYIKMRKRGEEMSRVFLFLTSHTHFGPSSLLFPILSFSLSHPRIHKKKRRGRRHSHVFLPDLTSSLFLSPPHF